MEHIHKQRHAVGGILSVWSIRYNIKHLTYNWRIFDSSRLWPYNFSSGSNGIGPSTAPLSSSSSSLENIKSKLIKMNLLIIFTVL